MSWTYIWERSTASSSKTGQFVVSELKSGGPLHGNEQSQYREEGSNTHVAAVLDSSSCSAPPARPDLGEGRRAGRGAGCGPPGPAPVPGGAGPGAGSLLHRCPAHPAIRRRRAGAAIRRARRVAEVPAASGPPPRPSTQPAPGPRPGPPGQHRPRSDRTLEINLAAVRDLARSS